MIKKIIGSSAALLTLSCLGIGYGSSALASGFNPMNMMNPSKWMGNRNNDRYYDDDDYYYGRGYGPYGYGGGPYGYGGGPYGYGGGPYGYGGYPGYGYGAPGYGYGAPGYGGGASQAPQQPAPPQIQ